LHRASFFARGCQPRQAADGVFLPLIQEVRKMSTGFYNSGMIRAMNSLSSISAQLAVSNQRLSTSKRVNSAADDPAGIIAASAMSADIAKLDAMTANGQRIGSMIDTADGAMGQITSLLGTIQSAATSAAGSTVTAEERAAYQEEIDSAINSIDRIVNTTSFNGTKLLDGGLAYSTSGIDNTKIDDVRVNSADTSGGNVNLDVAVVSAAEKGAVAYSGGNLTDTVTFTLTGPNGSEEFTFASGSHPDTDILNAVNAASDSTGVEATYAGGTLTFKTTEYGSDQTVSINVTQGTFAMVGGVASDSGADADVTVNGQAASADGMRVYFSSGDTSVKFTLKESFGNVGGGSTSMSVTGGGSDWALGADSWNKINFGLSPMGSASLGNDAVGMLNTLKSGGTNALSTGHYQQAANIASAALSQVATDRSRMGAVKSYAIDASLSAFAAQKEAISGEVSNIMDLDYAKESANNNRLQLLMQMGTSVIATLNQSYSSILSLLNRAI
jgi:flagellin